MRRTQERLKLEAVTASLQVIVLYSGCVWKLVASYRMDNQHAIARLVERHQQQWWPSPSGHILYRAPVPGIFRGAPASSASRAILISLCGHGSPAHMSTRVSDQVCVVSIVPCSQSFQAFISLFSPCSFSITFTR